MVQVSVIMPVYMAERYVGRAIESVLQQSFQDFELILVDDGSTDNCGEICDRYAQLDSRIRVVHQNNKGVSAARNRGLELASGKYIVFIDSDDWVEADYLKDLLSANADFVCQSFSVYDEKDRFIRKNGREPRAVENTFDNRLALLKEGALGYLHSKRFTSEIIKNYNIRFNEDIDHTEDTIFIIDYLQHAKSIQVENCCNYCYVRYNTRETLSGRVAYDRLAMVSVANHIICKQFFLCGSFEYEELYYSRIGYSFMDYIGGVWCSRIQSVSAKYFFLRALLKNEDVNKIIKYAPNALWRLPIHERAIRALYKESRLQLAYGCLCDYVSQQRRTKG